MFNAITSSWKESPIGWLILGAIFSAFLTLLVRNISTRCGWVVSPRRDRWHKRPTASFGGIAIYVTVVLLSVLIVDLTHEIRTILLASSLLFFVGLIDDVLNIKPYQKLLGQIAGALIVVGSGLVLQWTDSLLVNSAITFLWIVGITNAINLLDNMDGLAAGISSIAALFIGISLYFSGSPDAISLISIFIGALLGFLIFNFNPASIFMGDCGSLFIGFFLATSMLISQSAGRSRGVISVLAVPVFTFLVPIFDTTLVMVLRKLNGKGISVGGRDHTSHRLVALGLSEKKTVLLLYSLAFISGLLALSLNNLKLSQSIALITLFSLVLTLIGIYLAKVKVYENEGNLQNAAYAFLIDISHKRRIFEIFLDILLIALSYYGAFIVLFGSIDDDSEKWNFFMSTLPLITAAKLSSLLLFGVYRGIWRYTTVSDLVKFAKAVVFGLILSIALIFLIYDQKAFARSIFIMDAILLFGAISFSRLMFRVLRHLLPYPVRKDSRKVLIYGAGDGGEMVLREIRNNPELNYLPVGFIDDDPTKQGKTIHGLRVFGSNGMLADTCRRNGVQEILISCRNIKPENLQRVKRFCRVENIALRKMELKLEDIGVE